MANPSTLSAPTFYTRSDLQSNAPLTTQITNLINEAFARSKKPDPVKWGENPRKRFPTNDSYLEMLGTEGVVAVIQDDAPEVRRVVAVAGVIPWTGGWKSEGAGVEEGWEIKAVAVDSDARYLRRGLAVQLYASLEQYLVFQSTQLGHSTTGRKFEREDHLALWILAAECINGGYWRRKGYEFVRKDVVEAPTWGALTSFEMIVLRKRIPFEVPESKARGCTLTRADAEAKPGLEVA